MTPLNAFVTKDLQENNARKVDLTCRVYEGLIKRIALFLIVLKLAF
jgi:hypothetical protein